MTTLVTIPVATTVGLFKNETALPSRVSLVAQHIFAGTLFASTTMGTLGNLFLLTIILDNVKLRRQPAMIIISSLTACDALGGEVAGISYIIFTFAPSLTTSAAYCTTLGLIGEMVFLSHSIHMFVLAINRFALIYLTFKAPATLTSFKTTGWELLATWIISVLMRIWQHQIGGVTFFPFLTNCLINYHGFTKALFKIHLIWQYLNLVFISLLYVLMLRALKKRRRAIGNWSLSSAFSTGINPTSLAMAKEEEEEDEEGEGDMPTTIIDSVIVDSVNSPTTPTTVAISTINATTVGPPPISRSIRGATTRRKDMERDIAWYALFIFGVYLFVTLAFTVSEKISFPNILTEQIFSDIFSILFTLTFTMNPVVSFTFTKLFREEAKKFIKKYVKKFRKRSHNDGSRNANNNT